MKYLNKSFTLPAAPSNVTQNEWDRIFGQHENRPRPGYWVGRCAECHKTKELLLETDWCDDCKGC